MAEDFEENIRHLEREVQRLSLEIAELNRKLEPSQFDNAVNEVIRKQGASHGY